MTDQAIKTKTNTRPRFFIGACPRCGQSTGSENVFQTHFGYCLEHKLYWCFGVNIFASWCSETIEYWHDNAKFLSSFELVEGVFRPPDAARDAASPCPESQRLIDSWPSIPLETRKSISGVVGEVLKYLPIG